VYGRIPPDTGMVNVTDRPLSMVADEGDRGPTLRPEPTVRVKWAVTVLPLESVTATETV
jgi:hypothetical protein